MFFKISVLKNFANFTGKHLGWESLFNKFKAWNFIKKRLQYMRLPVKLAKFLRTPFFTEHLWWLLLKVIKNTLPNKSGNLESLKK